ncbi:hypothetical protein PoB_004013200 [Plakobranchus ocellatus]|uniref:Zasp-like motif domain-containing protein n=1 Tax=Plakobranchus ocellatus TaxID=259542 RepID=A0AAV4B262_9GAST|nr:hypothetical protein PoB_004013200 [Plakobranchus ocellatus]
MATPSDNNMAIPRMPKKDYNRGHLGQNNFSIGHDSSVTASTLQSVFKRDYKQPGTHGRAEIAQRPRLGDVMHKDERVCERASETVASFEYRPMEKPVLMGVANKLSNTNFKMDSDTSKVDSFNTTHRHYFKPKMGNTFEPLKQIIHTQTSSIPQGDREKADRPISDYKYKYLGIDTNKVRVERAKCMHDEGPPTIKGDDRLGHYITSSRTQFPGTWAPKVPILPVPPSYNIPVGDPEKEKAMLSVMQSSFDNYSDDIRRREPFDTGAVSLTLRKTNFKERDGHGVWDNYLTTAAESYIPKSLSSQGPSPQPRFRNTSDVPDGDREASRDKERMSMTTSRFHHGNPALGLHNQIVSGANVRTKSNVWFGDPTLNKLYYNSSTKDVYEPKSVPFTYEKGNCYIPSVIPLNYYGDRVAHEPTTSTDYTNPKQERIMPNPKALASLKGSHIPPPQKHMTFDTTHQDVYTPKVLNKHLYDSGRLQRSSVPLGTMAI